jgi:hypothetical protein
MRAARSSPSGASKSRLGIAIHVFGNSCRYAVGARFGEASHGIACPRLAPLSQRLRNHSMRSGVNQGSTLSRPYHGDFGSSTVAVLSMTGHTSNWKAKRGCVSGDWCGRASCIAVTRLMSPPDEVPPMAMRLLSTENRFSPPSGVVNQRLAFIASFRHAGKGFSGARGYPTVATTHLTSISRDQPPLGKPGESLGWNSPAQILVRKSTSEPMPPSTKPPP